VSPRLRRAGALGAGLVLLLSGCGFRGAYSLSLPGGADVGDHPYTVTIQFSDVLDLVPQSGVRVRDVPVGRVSDIHLGKNWTASVTVLVDGDVQLPANATAAIQQSSLLGEKYVELSSPTAEAPQGRLGNGSVIPLDRTSRNVEVEELLGALSLVLNGGGLAQLDTISRELGTALQGRESGIRNTLDQLQTFIGGLDSQKEQINRALDSVNALATTLAGRTGTIDKALDSIPPGLDVFNQQRQLLVSMLQSLARLGDVGTRIINESGADTVNDLKLLQPILAQLTAAGPDLANSLDLMLTYPFPASSLTTLDYRRDANTGGYGLFTNMTATLALDLRATLCRYSIDPVSGALEITKATADLTQCSTAAPGASTTSTTSTTRATTSTGPSAGSPPLSVPGLSGLAGTVVGPLQQGTAAGAGVVGLPQLGTGGSR
jgi:phospholipid/cholesterol/gamma-HCH transport system substrate-binding protein